MDRKELQALHDKIFDLPENVAKQEYYDLKVRCIEQLERHLNAIKFQMSSDAILDYMGKDDIYE